MRVTRRCRANQLELSEAAERVKLGCLVRLRCPGWPQTERFRVDDAICWSLESHWGASGSPATYPAGRSANESTESTGALRAYRRDGESPNRGVTAGWTEAPRDPQRGRSSRRTIVRARWSAAGVLWHRRLPHQTA